MLMDRLPQQAYGRMRMCRAMVNDHFTPAYLAAMTSAMAAFADGYPARRSKQLTDAATATVAGGHGSVSPAEIANVDDVAMLEITSGSAVSCREVTERSRRGSRAAIPGTAKPRPLTSGSQRAAHSHAKDA